MDRGDNDVFSPGFPEDGMSSYTKTIQVHLEPSEGTLGFTIRGGPGKPGSDAFRVARVDEGGPAFREGSVQGGDRLLAVDGKSLEKMSLREAREVLKAAGSSGLCVVLSLEYDIAIVHAVRSAQGALLIEVHRTPGRDPHLGLAFTASKDLILIHSIRQASIAERCGALHVGDQVLGIDGRKVSGMGPRDAEGLLGHGTKPSVQLEILPAAALRNKGSIGSPCPSCQGQGTLKRKPRGLPARCPSSASSSGTAFITRRETLTLTLTMSPGYGDFGLTLSSPGFHSDEKREEVREGRPLVFEEGREGRPLVYEEGREGRPLVFEEGREGRPLVYTVELVKEEGGLGITISGTENAGDPIFISSLTPGGLADRTGALHAGDRVLGIDGASLRDGTLSDAIRHLHQPGDRVTLRLSKESPRRNRGSPPGGFSPGEESGTWEIGSASGNTSPSGDDAELKEVLDDLRQASDFLVKPRLSSPPQTDRTNEESGVRTWNREVPPLLLPPSPFLMRGGGSLPRRKADQVILGDLTQQQQQQPIPIEIHHVTLFKDPIYEDFGFSVSDGLYQRGVYVNRIRKAGPASVSHALRPFDRILQVNGTDTRDLDCCLTVPLMGAAEDRLDLLVARHPHPAPLPLHPALPLPLHPAAATQPLPLHGTGTSVFYTPLSSINSPPFNHLNLQECSAQVHGWAKVDEEELEAGGDLQGPTLTHTL
ncbi:unnamed protein product [Darwinula stevensoni]|uniref:PDZ domain-containing protein n=1 Tax=Darwinula stevensoni TaxID=69355 RepID=A0A7R9AAV0_9CRUS|nr:unnamed protein product [Darwinula stevensoni]CAG0898790.1 unnamed protein product [Darwinula stevensoni]